MHYRFTGTSHHNKILEMVKSSDLLRWQVEYAYIYLLVEVQRLVYRQIAESLGKSITAICLKYQKCDKLRIEDIRFRTETSRMRDELKYGDLKEARGNGILQQKT